MDRETGPQGAPGNGGEAGGFMGDASVGFGAMGPGGNAATPTGARSVDLRQVGKAMVTPRNPFRRREGTR